MRDVPPDYYRRMHAVETSHWWAVGMRDLTATLLAPILARGDLALLDAGCGTGAFLRWAADSGAVRRLCGADISAEAVELARQEVPEAEIVVAPVHELPFEPGAFDVVTLNDVLQHVDERQVAPGLGELRRVLAGEGVLVVRTNGGRRSRRERPDWRLYDEATLRRELERAGLTPIRVTHVNMLPSLAADLRGRSPRAPSCQTCGVPEPAGRLTTAIGSAVLELESRHLRRPGRRIPYGHTLLALAQPTRQ